MEQRKVKLGLHKPSGEGTDDRWMLETETDLKFIFLFEKQIYLAASTAGLDLHIFRCIIEAEYQSVPESRGDMRFWITRV